MTTSFHVCSNCDGSCERVARAALIGRGLDTGERPVHTPWGQPDHIDIVKPGIVEYGTPSHGGWWVAPELRAKIPACVQIASFQQQGLKGWFEEDQDVLWVVACFPDLFGSQKAIAAGGQLSRAFDVLSQHWDESRKRNWQLALRCVYAKNGLAYGWTEVTA